MGNGMNKILPGLYIGNYKDAKDKEQLEANNITHIVSVHDKAVPVLENIKYKCVKVADAHDQDLGRYFGDCIEFIHQARSKNEGVLVHCIAGVSRSSTIAAAYVMAVTNLDWRDSISFIRCSRSISNPNLGFQRQLQDFQTEKLGEIKRRLTRKYHIDPNDDSIARACLEEGIENLSKKVDDGLHIDKIAHYERLKTSTAGSSNSGC